MGCDVASWVLVQAENGTFVCPVKVRGFHQVYVSAAISVKCKFRQPLNMQ
jgi:hypothetical protein